MLGVHSSITLKCHCRFSYSLIRVQKILGEFKSNEIMDFNSVIRLSYIKDVDMGSVDNSKYDPFKIYVDETLLKTFDFKPSCCNENISLKTTLR